MKTILTLILILTAGFCKAQISPITMYSPATIDSMFKVSNSEITFLKGEIVVLKNIGNQQQTVINTQAATMAQLQTTVAQQGTIVANVKPFIMDSTDFVVTRSTIDIIKLKRPIVIK